MIKNKKEICSLVKRGLWGQEIKTVCQVPGGYRLTRQYPFSYCWPVRSTVAEAIKDGNGI